MLGDCLEREGGSPVILLLLFINYEHYTQYLISFGLSLRVMNEKNRKCNRTWRSL